MKRRDLLKGAALAALPAAIAGCSVPPPPTARESRPEDAWLDRFGIDDTAIARARRELGGRGADFGEIFLQERRVSLTRLGGDAPAATRVTVQSGAGLRSVRGADVGFAATDELTADAILGAGRAAARGAAVDTVLAPFSTFEETHSGESAGAGWSAVDDGLRRDIVERLERQVRAADTAVTDVDVRLEDIDERVFLATIDGQMLGDRRPMLRLSVQAGLEVRGASHRGFASIAGRRLPDWIDAERLSGLAERVIADARMQLDARSAPAGELPIVLAAGASGVVIHEALGHAFEADFVAEAESPLGERTGERIASDAITLIDDATRPGERGALAIDDEGKPGRRTVLVNRGRLASFLYDRRLAARAGRDSTGNGRRESYRHAPLPRMTTTFIENGSAEPDELLERMGRGVIAESFAGGAVDLGGGEFRFRVRSGWFVEEGRRSVPLRDFEIVGNGLALLRDVELVANDFQMDPAGWLCGKRGQSVPVAHGMPSVLVRRVGVLPLEA